MYLHYSNNISFSNLFVSNEHILISNLKKFNYLNLWNIWDMILETLTIMQMHMPYHKSFFFVIGMINFCLGLSYGLSYPKFSLPCWSNQASLHTLKNKKYFYVNMIWTASSTSHCFSLSVMKKMFCHGTPRWNLGHTPS